MRGRKKGENSKTKVLSIRITEDQHELKKKKDLEISPVTEFITQMLIFVIK